MENTKKLYRINEGKALTGVCVGISEYTKVELDVVRILYIIASLISGIPIIIYIVLTFALPVKEISTFKKDIKEDEYAYDPEDYKI